MKQHDEHNEQHSYSDDYEPMDDNHKREIRRKLDDRMERRRLKAELEDYEGELDGEFDWDNMDKQD